MCTKSFVLYQCSRVEALKIEKPLIRRVLPQGDDLKLAKRVS